MPDNLIRNVPAALHASLKTPAPPLLPELIKIAGPPLTNKQLLAMIDDGMESRGTRDSSTLQTPQS